jgi:uncharacterized protein YukE
MAETKYQKRTKVRRMSDIERLAREYSKNVESMTGQYQQSYADYQKNVAAKMAPYETALEQYKTGMANYESQAASYRQRLAEYQKALQDFPTSEGTKVGVSKPGGKMGDVFNIGGTIYSAKDGVLPIDYYSKPVYETRYQTLRHSPGLHPYQALTGYELYKKTPPKKFTEEAPSAPTAPTKPEVAAFDQSQFEAKGKELGKTFQREVSERKAARLGAVSRRATRPMLQES